MRQLKITKMLTVRDEANFDKYLHEVNKEELITVEEEIELAKRIKKGDEEALDKLVRANLRFVISVAKHYQHQGLSLPDMVNEGNLGLIKAAKKFDETKGFKFISYAVWWIRQTILQALAEQSRPVRLPLNKISSINKARKTGSMLAQKLEREPTIEEIAREADLKKIVVEEAFELDQRAAHGDAPVSIDDEDTSLFDRVLTSDPDVLKQHDLDAISDRVGRVLMRLSPREQEILGLYYGLGGEEPIGLEEIALRFGHTKERIRQIKVKAERKFKNIWKNSGTPQEAIKRKYATTSKNK